MPTMQTLLYFYPIRTSFVRSDEEIVRDKYSVKSFFFRSSNKILTPYYFVIQFLFIAYYIFSCKKIVSQFSGYHTFLPALLGRIFSKPHYVILHGTECNNFPEYQYGYLLKPLLFWFSEKSLSWATKLLPVSNSLVSTNYTYVDTKYAHQGFKAFYKRLITPYEVIHNGISAKSFYIQKQGKRDSKTFITVATGLGSANRRGIKGLDLIISLAELTPDHQYTFIGAEKPSDLRIPDNIRIVPYIPHQDLVNYYNAHAFYLQLSVSEGFGISVCEAMLCGCIPIVSDVGMLPEIAGQDGYILKKKDVHQLLALIEKAKNEYSDERMERCRNHILDRYDILERKNKLLMTI